MANVSGDAWGGDIGLVTPMKLRVWYTEDRIFDVTNSEEVIAPWTISGGGGTTYMQTFVEYTTFNGARNSVIMEIAAAAGTSTILQQRG